MTRATYVSDTTNSQEKLDLSIVMPALNEEKNVRAAIDSTLRAFDDVGIDGEIIVVNDGSTDRTEAIVAEAIARDERVSVVRHERPQGIGASFWEGVDRARGKAVTMMPGDNENDPWEIFQYLRLLDHVDIVIPFVFNRQVRSPFRNVLSMLYRLIINSTFMVNFNYTNGTILWRRSVMREMRMGFRSTGFFFQTDALIRLVKKGYLFAEVPYRLGLRQSGTSKAVSFPSFFQVVRGYLRLVREIYALRGRKTRRTFRRNSATRRRQDEITRELKEVG